MFGQFLKILGIAAAVGVATHIPVEPSSVQTVTVKQVVARQVMTRIPLGNYINLHSRKSWFCTD